jgi:hypothetical protein
MTKQVSGLGRTLYGPPAERPSPQASGDGAFWVDPGNSQALYQVQSGNWVKIGTGTAAPPPPAGAPTLYGPYIVAYTDIPHDGDKKTLWTPQVGDVVLGICTDYTTLVQWDHGNLFIGQNVDGTLTPPLNCLTNANNNEIGGGGNNTLDMVGDAVAGLMRDASGHGFGTSMYVFHSADPVQIQLAQTGGTPPTQGHVEIYALIARAVAPS